MDSMDSVPRVVREGLSNQGLGGLPGKRCHLLPCQHCHPEVLTYTKYIQIHISTLGRFTPKINHNTGCLSSSQNLPVLEWSAIKYMGFREEIDHKNV